MPMLTTMISTALPEGLSPSRLSAYTNGEFFFLSVSLVPNIVRNSVLDTFQRQ